MRSIFVTEDGLFAVGTHRDNLDGNPQLVFQKTDVGIEFLRKFILGSHAGQVGFPARQFHVYRFDALFDRIGELGHLLAIKDVRKPVKQKTGSCCVENRL